MSELERPCARCCFSQLGNQTFPSSFLLFVSKFADFFDLLLVLLTLASDENTGNPRDILIDLGGYHQTEDFLSI